MTVYRDLCCMSLLNKTFYGFHILGAGHHYIAQACPDILESIDPPILASEIAEARDTYIHSATSPKIYKSCVGSGLTF